MTTTQQILVMAAMFVIQAVAIGLPYWIGRQAGKAVRDELQARVNLLQHDLRTANESVLSLHVRVGACKPDEIGGNHV